VERMTKQENLGMDNTIKKREWMQNDGKYIFPEESAFPSRLASPPVPSIPATWQSRKYLWYITYLLFFMRSSPTSIDAKIPVFIHTSC
jgi:hypothetical protein